MYHNLLVNGDKIIGSLLYCVLIYYMIGVSPHWTRCNTNNQRRRIDCGDSEVQINEYRPNEHDEEAQDVIEIDNLQSD